jgi:hypothetical protein
MDKSEIFNLLASGLSKDIPEGTDYESAILNISRQPGMVEFKSELNLVDGKIINLEVSLGYKYAKAVLELYELSQNQFPIHTDWNRAIFKLFPNKKFEIEYYWDQEFQDRFDNIS